MFVERLTKEDINLFFEKYYFGRCIPEIFYNQGKILVRINDGCDAVTFMPLFLLTDFELKHGNKFAKYEFGTHFTMKKDYIEFMKNKFGVEYLNEKNNIDIQK